MEKREFLVRYLLGELPDEDRERVETNYFMDKGSFEELAGAENDLIDSYLRDRLPKCQRARFESYFLHSPAKRKRVEFAKVLAQSANAYSSPGPEKARRSRLVLAAKRYCVWITWNWRSPIKILAVSMAGLVILAAGLDIGIENHRLQTRLSAFGAERMAFQHQIKELKARTGTEPRASRQENSAAAPASQVPLAAMLLTSGSSRGGAERERSPVLRLFSEPSLIVLSLVLDRDDFPLYDVVIQTAEGRIIQRAGSLRSCPISGHGSAVPVVLSSKLLRQEDYVATLLGHAPDGKPQTLDAYTFRVAIPRPNPL